MHPPVGMRVESGMLSEESVSCPFLVWPAGGLLYPALYQKVEAGLFFWVQSPGRECDRPGPGFGTYTGLSLALPATREDSCAEETKACLGHRCQERGCYLWAQPLWPGSLGWHHRVPPSVPKPSERSRLWAEGAAIQVVLAL